MGGLPWKGRLDLGMDDGQEAHSPQVDGIGPQGQGFEEVFRMKEAPADDQANLAFEALPFDEGRPPAQGDEGGQAGRHPGRTGSAADGGRLNTVKGDAIHSRFNGDGHVGLQVIAGAELDPNGGAIAGLPQPPDETL